MCGRIHASFPPCRGHSHVGSRTSKREARRGFHAKDGALPRGEYDDRGDAQAVCGRSSGQLPLRMRRRRVRPQARAHPPRVRARARPERLSRLARLRPRRGRARANRPLRDRRVPPVAHGKTGGIVTVGVVTLGVVATGVGTAGTVTAGTVTGGSGSVGDGRVTRGSAGATGAVGTAAVVAVFPGVCTPPPDGGDAAGVATVCVDGPSAGVLSGGPAR